MSYSTSYKGYGIEVGDAVATVVQWGVIHGEFSSANDAYAYVDDRLNQFPSGSEWWMGNVKIIVRGFDGSQLSYRHKDSDVFGHMGECHWARLVRA